MRNNSLKVFLAGTFLTILFSGAVWSQKKTIPMRNVKTAARCSTGELAFPCPSNYKVLSGDIKPNAVFFAKSTEFPYAVFALLSNTDSNEKNLEDVVTESIMPAFFRDNKRPFKWKDVESDKRASSKFETGKRRAVGFNGDRIVTLEFRHITFKARRLLVGTVVDGGNRGDSAFRDFEIGAYVTNGGCFDALKIIHFFTGEKESDDMDPCRFTITSVE
jgi:hypothetical protein